MTFSGILILGWWYYKRDGGMTRVGRQRSGGTGPDRSARAQPAPKPRRKKDITKDQETSEAGSSDVPETKVPNVNVGEDDEKKLEPRKRGNKYQKVNLAETSAVSLKPTASHSLDQDEKDERDVKEFARQMAKAKAGTSLTRPAKDNQRVRTQKPSKLHGNFDGFASDNVVSEASSNTGADADDDMSSAPSPELGATSTTIDSTGVSDMLEAPSAGPSSLRITPSLAPQRSQPPKKIKAEPTETKKQRQARLRREREKEAAKEIEAQRRVLEEKQRRTAREAEGRPAKNGNGWTYASGLPANAWGSGALNTPTETKHSVNGPMLDTREEAGQFVASKDRAVSVTSSDDTKSNIDESAVMTNGAKTENIANGTAAGSININGIGAEQQTHGKARNAWESGLPSEEEQMRMFNEQMKDSEWTTIPVGKRNKRRPVAEDKKAETSSNKSLDFDVTI